MATIAAAILDITDPARLPARIVISSSFTRLDEMLGLSSGGDKGELLKAMEGHILAQGELMGTFSK